MHIIETILAAVTLSYFMTGITFCMDLTVWRSVKISHSRLITGAVQNGSTGVNVVAPSRTFATACSIECQQMGWCNLWCPDRASNRTCLFFDMYVVYGYNETNLSDALDCYTRRPRDFAVGAIVEGKPADRKSPKRVITHMIDGFYQFGNLDDCYRSSDFYYPWFKLDLKHIRAIRRILFVLQPNSSAKDLYDFEIRIGKENLTEQNFPQYEVFGYFPGPSFESQAVILDREPPVWGRYITFQRLTKNCPADGSLVVGYCMLQLCHIEIN
ncbi:uncharacterized protein [Palaemon carinicauda]|uniref:uncharacterized protein n=1 Tax=Palaemon carinicauda TaxID=392227 RepID=UPI0035B57C33